MIETMYSQNTRDLSQANGGMDEAQISSVAGLVGESSAMQRLLEQISQAAGSHANVLIVGEPGTGKELVARCIHELSSRADQPFLVVSCGALPPALIEAELFGCERDALPNVSRTVEGYIERAGSGTLVLDEITELPEEMQIKLLEALDSRRLRRVGGEKWSELRCRIVAATQSDPQKAVAQGKLRPELLYSIGVFPILVPPLRERDDDVELLARYFLAELNGEEGTNKRFSPESMAAIHQHTWPGNVRELRNAVQRAFIMAQSELDLTDALGKPVLLSPPTEATVLRIPVGTNLADVERWMIMATLKKCGGNKTRAAALLGVSLKTLYNRLNAYRAEGRDLSHVDAELTEVSE